MSPRPPDGTRCLIHAYTASHPGVYYLCDAAKRKIEEVAVIIPDIDPEQMAEVKPVEFKARDVVNLHGYLTLPKGASQRTCRS